MSERIPAEELPVGLEEWDPAPAREPRAEPRRSRATTVVWGLLLVALGAIAVLGGLGVAVDPVLALVGVLVLLAVGLLLSAVRGSRR